MSFAHMLTRVLRGFSDSVSTVLCVCSQLLLFSCSSNFVQPSYLGDLHIPFKIASCRLATLKPHIVLCRQLISKVFVYNWSRPLAVSARRGSQPKRLPDPTRIVMNGILLLLPLLARKHRGIYIYFQGDMRHEGYRSAQVVFLHWLLGGVLAEACSPYYGAFPETRVSTCRSPVGSRWMLVLLFTASEPLTTVLDQRFAPKKDASFLTH